MLNRLCVGVSYYRERPSRLHGVMRSPLVQIQNKLRHFWLPAKENAWYQTYQFFVSLYNWKKLLNTLVFILIKSPHGPNGLNQNGKGSQTLQKIIENQWGLSPAQILSLLHVEYTHFFYMVKLSDGKPQLIPTT